MNSVDTLYYKDKPIVFYKADEPAGDDLIKHGFTPAIPESSDFVKMMAKLNQPDETGLFWLLPAGIDVAELLNGHFTVFTAGGGLVLNQSDEILMIHRRGKWDLPKGKLDEGETIEQCAVREVEEETGIGNISLGHYLCTTWHLYEEKGKMVIKKSVWFKMTTTDTRQLVPQTEEDILQAIWAAPATLSKYLKDTYPTITDVFREAGYNWSVT